MKHAFRVIVIFTAVMALFACDNFYHDLIPPDGDRIESFYIPGQSALHIGDNAVTVTVPSHVDLTELIPSIRVSSGATLFPVTHEYTARAFNDERTFGSAMELYTSGNMTERVVQMIRENKSFTRPVIDMPIDFDYPVDFLVISGKGTIRRYTVRIEVDTGEGKFNSFRFEKFYNPEVVRTATGVIDKEAKTVTVNISYPVENIASYQLTPSFETNGARVYLEDGTEWRSGETLVGFIKPPDSSDLSNLSYGIQTKTLTLKRSGYDDAEWTLTVNFSEDPDTSRAITDFRFTRSLNPLINADYMAEIANNGNTGTINVTVYYSGAKPEELRANFISPGTVTVNENMQTTGYSTQDFSAPIQYVVTSRVGSNVRTYTVTVNLVPASDPLPQITYFSFRTGQNPLLVSNSTAMIDHNSRIILIEAAYDGDTPPFNLIPDFSGTGTVTVNGVTQNSGSSSVNFSGPVIYAVSNSSNPTLKREYRVEVKFVKSLSSAAEIETFTFYKADNPGLIADVSATVNQITGAITATLLFETPGGNRTLVPRWSSQGRVEAGGVTQTSGTGRQFYTPQTYRAVSADGIFQKNYTVTIKEVNNRIYVRQNAAGRNDGTNWQNAYRNLPGACNDAALFPENVLKEVWIAEGTYTPSDRGDVSDYLTAAPNTSYIGGFRGNEASVSARVDPANRRAVITGDLGGGRRSGNIFMNAYLYSEYYEGYGDYYYNKWYSNGVYSFEYLALTAVNDINYDSASINISCTDIVSTVLMIKNMDFSDLVGNNGGAVFFRGGVLAVSDTAFRNIRAINGGGVFLGHDCDSFTITNSLFENCRADRNGGAICNSYVASFEITDTKFINCTARGGGKIMYNGRGTFRRCVFEDTNALYIYDDSTVDLCMGMFSFLTGYFENCTFSNLRYNRGDGNFIFNRNGKYYSETSSIAGADRFEIVWTVGFDVTLRNCTFNFGAESAGLCAGYSGDTSWSSNPDSNSDSFLMDGVTINNNGCRFPIFWFDNNVYPGIFRFMPNNVYNGTTLSTMAAITSLGSSVVKLTQGATPVIAP
jgi:hypothetical protein